VRVHGPLDAYHKVDGALAKFFNQEIFLSNADSVLARTCKLRVDAQPEDVVGRPRTLTSAIEFYGALYHSVDKIAHNFQLFLIPES
jgi:hypothetical protein